MWVADLCARLRCIIAQSSNNLINVEIPKDVTKDAYFIGFKFVLIVWKLFRTEFLLKSCCELVGYIFKGTMVTTYIETVDKTHDM